VATSRGRNENNAPLLQWTWRWQCSGWLGGTCRLGVVVLLPLALVRAVVVLLVPVPPQLPPLPPPAWQTPAWSKGDTP
jgi:hypothetical protein